MVTHTSISDFMGMTLKRFYQIFVSTCNILEKRKGN